MDSIETYTKQKQKIMIVDDSIMNRTILVDMLGNEFEIIEAEDGVQAVALLQQHHMSLSLMLLDIVMPRMDGFDVLNVMNKNHWSDEVPVIMISVENTPSYVEWAYELGVSDFISRPFDALIVHRRVVNTIMLYAKQKKLMAMVADQMYEKEKNNNLMIAILSHIVEFRNSESASHVIHIRMITDILFKQLRKKTDKYSLDYRTIAMISTASALHDIGKIGVDERILNKPGKLTKEEFEQMKRHTLIGAEMLKQVSAYQEEPLMKTAYEICRWHHERYDGKGYPDGLRGENIPISAQVVSVADVYDALVSVRVYKPALSHEEAIKMILEGKCGAFSPLLLECLLDVADQIREELKNDTFEDSNQKEIRNITEEILSYEEKTNSDRTLQMLEQERVKYEFFASMSEEVQFEYTETPPMLTILNWGVKRFHLDRTIVDPLHNKDFLAVFGIENWRQIELALHNTTPESPIARYDCEILVDGTPRWNMIICRANWSTDDPPQFLGAIGKMIDVHDRYMKMAELEHRASHDPLTGLLNHAAAKTRIEEKLKYETNKNFALLLLDMDHFKQANDQFGHIFGDQVLRYAAENLRHSIREEDIAARVGGDEFLVFLEYKNELEPIVQRIFQCLTKQYEGFPIQVSMGVAQTEIAGRNYRTLFHRADQALYAVKWQGKGKYRYYDESLKQFLKESSFFAGEDMDPFFATEQKMKKK